jgi:arsenate reductase (glutaredoxin)
MAGKPGKTVIYHNPKCTTSRKTLDLLWDSGFEPIVVQYLKTPPSGDESPASGWGPLPLAGACPQVKMIRDARIDVRTAVRKREPLYAELNLADATDDELLDAMAEHPLLIERPFVVTPKGTRLARPIDAVREIL